MNDQAYGTDYATYVWYDEVEKNPGYNFDEYRVGFENGAGHFT